MAVNDQHDDAYWMQRALRLAAQAERLGEVPVGAVIVKDGVLLAEGWNQPIVRHDPSAHAEVVAMREAGRALRNYRLVGTTLYVTLEPCSMCVGAMIHARVDRLVFGASEPKTGALGGAFDLQSLHAHNHRLEVCGGVLAEQSRQQLQAFFRARRNAGRSKPV